MSSCCSQWWLAGSVLTGLLSVLSDIVEAIVLPRHGGLHSFLPGEGVNQYFRDLRAASHTDRGGQLLRVAPLAHSAAETLSGGLVIVIVQVGVAL